MQCDGAIWSELDLQAFLSRFADPRSLARYLLQRNWLTAYQINQIYLGKAKVVELHFFGGLTYAETATALDVSEATVDRDLRMAKAMLARAMSGGFPSFAPSDAWSSATAGAIGAGTSHACRESGRSARLMTSLSSTMPLPRRRKHTRSGRTTFSSTPACRASGWKRVTRPAPNSLAPRPASWAGRIS